MQRGQPGKALVLLSIFVLGCIFVVSRKHCEACFVDIISNDAFEGINALSSDFKPPRLPKSTLDSLSGRGSTQLHSGMPPESDIDEHNVRKKKSFNIDPSLQGILLEPSHIQKEFERHFNITEIAASSPGFDFSALERPKPPPGWNYTRNPGVSKAFRFHEDIEPYQEDALPLDPSDSSFLSSDQISEEIDEFFRDMAKKEYDEAVKRANETNEPFDTRKKLESLYKAARDDFLNETQWREVHRPRYFSPGLEYLGKEISNRSYHEEKLVKQLKNLTIPHHNIDLFQYRQRMYKEVPTLPLAPMAHRFRIPENEFYKFLLQLNVTIAQAARFGSYIRYSENWDLIEDLQKAGVPLDVMLDIHIAIKRVAERPVEYEPAMRLPKREELKLDNRGYEDAIGLPRVPELRRSIDGWWLYRRHYEQIPTKSSIYVDYERQIIIQHTTIWRLYERQHYQEWQAAREGPEDLQPQLHYRDDGTTYFPNAAVTYDAAKPKITKPAHQSPTAGIHASRNDNGGVYSDDETQGSSSGATTGRLL